MNSKFNELKKFSENKYLTSSMCRSVTIYSIVTIQRKGMSGYQASNKA